jgi:hypothetical protein
LEDFLIKWAKRHDTPNCVIASVLENAASRWRDRE